MAYKFFCCPCYTRSPSRMAKDIECIPVCSPQGLRQRIRHSYEARWRAEKHFDEEEIMQELPNSLRTEVCHHRDPSLVVVVLRMHAPAMSFMCKTCAIHGVASAFTDFAHLSAGNTVPGVTWLVITGQCCWQQVCLYTCGDLIASVPFFEDAEEGFTTSVITLLRPAVRAGHRSEPCAAATSMHACSNINLIYYIPCCGGCWRS